MSQKFWADPLGENLIFPQIFEKSNFQKFFWNFWKFPGQKFSILRIFDRNFFPVPELAPLLPQFESPYEKGPQFSEKLLKNRKIPYRSYGLFPKFTPLKTPVLKNFGFIFAKFFSQNWKKLDFSIFQKIFEKSKILSTFFARA